MIGIRSILRKKKREKCVYESVIGEKNIDNGRYFNVWRCGLVDKRYINVLFYLSVVKLFFSNK